MEREIGYYWVNVYRHLDSEPARWFGGFWHLLGSEALWYDKDFYKIGKRIINDNID